MEIIEISTEYIKLDQFLKWVNIVGSGVEAKFLIKEGQVKVNKEVELRRGKKLRDEDIIEIDKNIYKIKRV
ncbi:S4 domain-containing protein YaaA [Haliovirga abyssi]|uniref:RNA-binding protein S4 n=1 Tax=Haliovirga abyssi TaxID=2996794 RepID=A0AAU9DBE0_9FUSO|nr:S4 domain-containing protein YaaA [Haliovirga abyssi]BDU49433.1 RNA-binding protein S4 [Haliovirga abyssi]